MKINIVDVNDNKPEFYKCGNSGDCVKASHFTGDVYEHSLGSISINMTVRDLDKVTIHTHTNCEAIGQKDYRGILWAFHRMQKPS